MSLEVPRRGNQDRIGAPGLTGTSPSFARSGKEPYGKRKQTILEVNLAFKTGGGLLLKLNENPALELVGDLVPYMDVVLINNLDSTASDLIGLDGTSTISRNASTTKRNIVNLEANLRVKRIRNLMEGREELKKIRLETATIQKEKALEELKKARYETELAKLRLETYINSK
ncbi:hypothetical protein FQA39_LY16332 [Lamprigera yunnana]|nr:hypothetical protein FQA39_LY16332 [Lamprigera yunnana]